jgi:hypothetical protein
VGHDRTRKGFAVLMTLGVSRAMAGTLVFSKEPPDVLWAICRGIWRRGGLPELLGSDPGGQGPGRFGVGSQRPRAANDSYDGFGDLLADHNRGLLAGERSW